MGCKQRKKEGAGRRKSAPFSQYYVRTKGGSRTGKYINKSNRELAVRLAQKEYDLRVLEHTNAKIQCLQQMSDVYDVAHQNEVWEQLHPLKKALIKPYQISSEEYLSQWEAIAYQGKEFYENTPEIYAEKGEIEKYLK